jgi:hypothetical protein
VNKLPGLLIVIGFLFVGIILIVGTYKRWTSLVDPPTDEWMFYSHAFLKKCFGKTFLIYFNYSIGAILILSGLIGIWNGIRK